MRHGNKVKKIGRTHAHRKATLTSLSSALIAHKRITTTLGKAKALRVFVEPILNRAKDDSTASRRQAFRRLQDKEAVKTLFGEVAEAIGNRQGGYTRIVKLGYRHGDAAEMAIVELVDFNDAKPEGSAGTKRRTRRSRRGGAAKADGAQPKAEKAQPKAEPKAEKAQPEASAEPVPDTSAPPESTPEAQAVHSDNPNPDTTGNPQVPQGPSGGSSDGADHGDSEQGAPAGTGNPIAESHATNLGRSEHRG